MEPENHIEMIIEGYQLSSKKYPLILVGNTNTRLGKVLKRKYTNPKIKFTEGIYHDFKIDNLRFFSTLYFHGHSVGGTNPSLLEAMACSCAIVAHANIFNKAVLDTSADYFSSSSDITSVIDSPPSAIVLDERKKQNVEKIKKNFNWDKVVDDYEEIFLRALYSKS
jgi:glycosyltransferase involved in cell wall biosynthesis